MAVGHLPNKSYDFIIMTWFFLVSLTAIFESFKDVFGKKSLEKIDEPVVACASMVCSTAFLIPALFITKIPSLDLWFWMALMISGTLNTVTTILYVKAIKTSDLSITMPMITFTPLFLLITSPIIVGEYANIFDLSGILLIILGSYTLNLKQKQRGYLAPFQALLTETGPKLMLCVAFIWSITSNIDKIGVNHSSATFWPFALYGFMAIALLPMMLMKIRHPWKQIKSNFRILSYIGFFNALAITFQMLALTLTFVSHVIAVKRTSALMSVFLGHLIFQEKGMKERLAGAAIMLTGVLLITLF